MIRAGFLCSGFGFSEKQLLNDFLFRIHFSK